MKTILYKAGERGHVQHGWLNTYHSFSFGNYYNPNNTNFGALRVLNDDTFGGGMGFGTHPHSNMEIVTLPLSGALKHCDSTGTQGIISQNDVQIMSAGSGIQHSEMNANKNEAVQLLQIWVMPKLYNVTPRYEQKTFDIKSRKNKLQTVVAPDDEGAVQINQDAWFLLGDLTTGFTDTYSIKNKNNGAYFFVIEGKVEVAGTVLSKRDAVGIWETESIDIKATEKTELLIIDVPMNFTNN